MTKGLQASTLRFAAYWKAIGFVFVTAVIVLSLLPEPIELAQNIINDKIIHFFAYVGLTFWFAQLIQLPRHWLLSCLLVGMGVAIEGLQWAGGHRFFELADIAANTLGVVVGLMLARTRLGELLPMLDGWLVATYGDS